MAIINNNVQNVKFLRNAALYTTRADALAALEAQKVNALDGTALLARYQETEDETVTTLVGFVYVNGNTHDITVFDVKGASADVEALREEINNKLGEGVTSANTVTDQLEALSGTTADTSATTSVAGAKAYADDLISNLDGSVTADTGYYVKTVTEADGKISGTTEALPTVATISEEGKPITAVSENLGTISASAGTIEAQYVTAAGFTAGTVQGVLEEIDDKIDSTIEALDFTDTASAKTFVTKVDEADGVISTTKGTITSTGKTIVLTDNVDSGVNFEANVDGETIIIDENTGTMSVASSAFVQYEGDDDTVQISAVNNGIRTVSSPLTIQKVTTGLSEIVKEEYRLVGASGNTIGTPVQIYKDSHIVSITYITEGEHAQNLEYVYVDASGNTRTTYVDMSELVLEAEFASGVTVTDGIAHGVVDQTSESFLKVGSDGFKLSGVQDAIDSAVSGAVETLDANLSGNSTHVTVGVVEEDGIITAVTVSEDNIANADDLAELSGKTVTAITSTNGSITASIDDAVGNKTYNIETDASKIAMSGFTADVSGFTAISESSSVTDAFKAVETFILDNELVVSNALNDLEATKLENIVVNGETGTVTSNVATVTIDGGDIALTGYESATTNSHVVATDTVNEAIGKLEKQIFDAAGGSSTALEEEIAARQRVDGINGSAYTANAGANYISGATSLNNADVLLDTALDAVEDRMVSGATMNGSAVTKSDESLAFTAVASTSAGTATGNEAIVITTDANGGLTFALDTLDCGTY